MEDQPQLIAYRNLLMRYVSQDSYSMSEDSELLSGALRARGVSPDDLVNMHIDVLKNVSSNLDNATLRSLYFLSKIMEGYGSEYREHQTLKNRQKQLDTELDVAAEVQKALLEGKVPACSFADIGAISEPAKKMSGDYYRIVNDGGRLAVTIADIVGKGIPAAMCMSMIKYAMDSLPENSQGAPPFILSSLNRVVERNVDPSMFITMFYGVYDPLSRIFSFASAGHEPGFYYSASKDQFEELEARGLSLGLAPGTRYKEYSREIAKGDMLFLLTDGVTEARTDNGFIERKDIVDLIRQSMHLPAAKMVKQIIYELKKMQHFNLHDDFTFIAMKF
ncbi:PP2C family protein-serine/threonine phosphatase [Sporolactobacillus laevolacticus]|uniref:PP2C family protein-serine/threonine phosphatase n=1 Tax=Sporolactobacillus laevolacticus TaxID=33018 RepID=UPI0025B5CF6F|nr:PP2C family protein-serine/threonine phosphatase [Sporolactobacillus laevolacticus]MDN3956965.1 PP2C family protein-serine/threonine phosphatase [Sporolactobacillus laevolacticus]